MLTIAFQDQDQTVHQMASAAPVINPGPSDLRISSNDNKKDLYDGNTYPHFDLRPVKLKWSFNKRGSVYRIIHYMSNKD